MESNKHEAAGVENSVVSSRLTYKHINTEEHTFVFMPVCLQLGIDLHSLVSCKSPRNLEMGYL